MELKSSKTGGTPPDTNSTHVRFAEIPEFGNALSSAVLDCPTRDSVGSPPSGPSPDTVDLENRFSSEVFDEPHQAEYLHPTCRRGLNTPGPVSGEI